MTQRMEGLAAEIIRLQGELDREIERRRKALGWTLKGKFVAFEKGLVAEQRKLRTGLASYVSRASLGTIATAPIIYSLIVPIALLDLWTSLYQAICFRAYGIVRVRRADFIAMDRRRLSYLNGIEALNCLYCSYANGVVGYVREVAGRTEQYWCPIKHAVRISAPHDRYRAFLDYGDAEGYRLRLDAFRTALRDDASAGEITTLTAITDDPAPSVSSRIPDGPSAP